jgi:hypothetical protein
MTSIDEVIILRKAKRLGSGVREEFSTSAGRKRQLGVFQSHVDDHPLALDAFLRLVQKLKTTFPEATAPDETSVLTRGFF